MKFLKNDVLLLLAFILFFCFGLGFLRNDREDIFFSIDPFMPCSLNDENFCGAVNDRASEIDQNLEFHTKKKYFNQNIKEFICLTQQDCCKANLCFANSEKKYGYSLKKSFYQNCCQEKEDFFLKIFS